MRESIDSKAIDSAVTWLASRIEEKPAIALVLGSGLGDFGDRLSNAISIRAGSIPCYPVSSVEGHAGELVFGTLKADHRESLRLLVFKGRVHFYETGDLEAITFPVQVAHRLGARILLATNAAGGINRDFVEGDLMLIEDFLNQSPLNPQWQVSSTALIPSVVKSKPCLDEQLSGLFRSTARDLNIPLRSGTYCYLKGPSYETKAEIEMLRRIGADAVGMSTVPEILVGAGLGLRVGAISLISNLAAGLGEERLTHTGVAETASRVRATFTALLTEAILRINS